MFLSRFLYFDFLLLVSTTINAHGPSRQKVSENQINAESTKV